MVATIEGFHCNGFIIPACVIYPMMHVRIATYMLLDCEHALTIIPPPCCILMDYAKNCIAIVHMVVVVVGGGCSPTSYTDW